MKKIFLYFTVRSYMRLNTVVICLQITMECAVISRVYFLHFTLVRWGPDMFHKLAWSVLILKIFFFTYVVFHTCYTV